MKFTKFLFTICLMVNFSCQSQKQVSRIEIVEPTIAQEATSIWRTINDIAFFEKQGYNIHLPKNSIIDSLVVKSKKGTFGNDDYTTIYSLLETTIFDQKKYTKAIQKVENDKNLINSLINTIDAEKSQWNWNFKMFETYKVVLTLYGTGGSYDPDAGIITLFTDENGKFMNYKNPVNTIIHEITHMGVENSIVRKYKLSHGLKERIVDTVVYLMFKEKLPEYSIQNMGDKNIDRYLNKKEDIKSLDTIVSKFTNK